MNIVILDYKTLGEGVTLEPLFKEGNLHIYDFTQENELEERINECDIIIVNKKKLNEVNLKNAKNLKLICVFAIGYNNIDIEYCAKNNITVCNAGSYSTNAVAQHTFSLILEHYNKVSAYNKFVQNGLWKRSKTFSPFVYSLNELAGKTIGIVGYGNIGKAVAKIANAFEMNVLVFNRSKKTDSTV